MGFLTDRKRAVGRGASHTGTEHHWFMQVSSAALAILIPTFIFYFGSALGSTHEEVLATFSRPFPAILTALVLVVGLQHFNKGAQMMIEDYLQGSARKAAIIFTICLSYTLMATGLFALVKLAL